ncbi:HNH endonuclease signature motif containing protein [uncultured Corynebacterium sp.]|uniref:HNH endonuclease signature motif containing protein n=1 Tax=uncultured Corynebacterium sp. TaxID=159447 RepID=UPI00262FC88A|nr:HNH endonuclease signature motif containing protein [uncultured Corynebacterium sp.]
MFEHSTTTPCWRITDPNDPLSAAACEVNRGHVNLAVACTPEMNDCVIDVSTRLAVRLGLTEYRALTLVEIGHMFRRFPSILELARTGAYSLDLLRCMAECLSPVKEDVPEIFEEKIFKAISPTVPNQAMLARATIRSRIEQVIRKHDPQALPEEPKDADTGSSARLDIDDRPDTTTVFFLTLPKLEGLEVLKAVNSVAKSNSCSRAEALMQLVRRQTTAEVTLNLYRSVDEPDSQIWAAGGWLSSLATPEWMKRVTHVQIPGAASNEGYSPTPLVRAGVEGRDGTCRFPGCSVPAHKCQLDHVQRYDHENPQAGGPTATSNLHCLCTKHHNAKTTGSWDVTIHPNGNETWTSHGDGHTVMTAPNGPLGRETFAQRAENRRRAA